MGNSPFPIIPNLSPVMERVSRGNTSLSEVLARLPAGQKGHGGINLANSGAPFNPLTIGPGPGPPVGTAGIVTANSYGQMRTTAYTNTTSILLNDPYKGGLFLLSPTQLRDNGGTVINDASGQSWVRIVDNYVNAAWFWNAPTGHLGDGTGLQIGGSDFTNNPQLIGMPNGSGMYPAGTTWAYVCLMEAIYACFAQASVPGAVTWNLTADLPNLPLWIPHGKMIINQGLVLNANGVNIQFAARQSSYISYQGPSGTIAWLFNSLAYGTIHNLTISDDSVNGCNVLVSLDHTSGAPGLETQQLTLYDWYLSGWYNNQGIGLYVSESGGAAQGDTILIVNPIIIGFGSAGLATGGQNALSIFVLEGDFQNCYCDGVAVYAGTVFLYGTSFQTAWVGYYFYPQQGQIGLGGADFHAYSGAGGTARQVVEAVRSENNVLVLDNARQTTIRDSGVAQAQFGSWTTTSHYPLGYPIKTNGLINTAAILVDDGGPQYFLADATSSTTLARNPNNPGWTVNEWVNFLWSYRFGNGTTQQGGPITASDANSITVTTAFPGSAANHWIKIVGQGGATQPNWDAVAQGGSSVPGTPLYGFTTVAGSPSIKNTTFPLANGMGVCVCGADAVQEASTSTLYPGPLVGIVANYNAGAGTFNIVDKATGTPKNAGYSLTDAPGYYGTVVTDGQLSWLPLDFDVIMGVLRGDEVFVPVGRGRWNGNLDLTSQPQQTFFRDNETNPQLFRFRNSSNYGYVYPSILLNGTMNIVVGNLTGLTNVVYSLQANATLNFPLLSDALYRELTLIISGGGGNVLTWGTNIKATAASLNITGTQTFIINAKWFGNKAGGGSWYFGIPQGPM